MKETSGYRGAMASRYPLVFIRIKPLQNQEDALGGYQE